MNERDDQDKQVNVGFGMFQNQKHNLSQIDEDDEIFSVNRPSSKFSHVKFDNKDPSNLNQL